MKITFFSAVYFCLTNQKLNLILLAIIEQIFIFLNLKRLLTSLMILFLYKCIEIVVIDILKWCVCTSSLIWSNTLCFYLLWISFVILMCVYFLLLWCWCQYISDEILICCTFAVCKFRVGVRSFHVTMATFVVSALS